MMKTSYDLIFLGGGLANGLAAARIQEKHPRKTILILEKGGSLGGNHTWSFHASDLTPAQFDWVRPFISKTWPAHEVVFPNLRRIINAPYHSIRSEQFHKVLSDRVGIEVKFNSLVRRAEPTQAMLDDGSVIQANCVLDGRGWRDSIDVPSAYQKFLGLEMTLRKPHGLTRPFLMDATPTQKDGFRFFYVLPWTEKSLLVEDTRYSDTSHIDEAEYRDEILNYVRTKRWEAASIDREETGALTIPLEGALPNWPNNVSCSGTRAGLFHATTGYSFPPAVRFAEALSELQTFEPAPMFNWCRTYAERHWAKESFFRLLNRLLFRAAPPAERYRVLEKFYRHNEELVGRFYAGQINFWDQFRLLSGKPPVSIGKALTCLLEKRKPI